MQIMLYFAWDKQSHKFITTIEVNQNKKTVSIVLVFVFAFNLSVMSFAANEKGVSFADSVVLTSEEVRQLKTQYSLQSISGKRQYAAAVLKEVGAEEDLVHMLSDKLIAKIASGQEFGFISSDQLSTAKAASVPPNGSIERTQGKMRLGIFWVRVNSTYTLMGVCSWQSMPISRLKDTISIDISGTGSITNGSQNLLMQYTKDGIARETEYTNSSEESNQVGTACSFTVKLPRGTDKLDFIISYDITCSSHNNTVFLQYFHQNTPVTVSVSASFYIGVSVGMSFAYTEYNLQCGVS